MKSKKGYLKQKSLSNIGRWLKRYFEKKTCRRRRDEQNQFRDGSRADACLEDQLGQPIKR